jgi:DNA-binding SARP family transcriptional activator
MFRLLGPPELRDDSGPLLLARRKSLALLAYLALEEGVHARDSLAALFWPECDQTRARGNLRSSLFELARALGKGSLDSIQDHIRLDRGRVRIDVDILLSGSRSCAHGPDGLLCPTCLGRVEAAVRAAGGSFMAGFTLAGCPDFDDWQFRWSTRLKGVYAPLLRRLIPPYRAEGRVDEAARMAERWIEAEPYDEEAIEGPK